MLMVTGAVLQADPSQVQVQQLRVWLLLLLLCRASPRQWLPSTLLLHVAGDAPGFQQLLLPASCGHGPQPHSHSVSRWQHQQPWWQGGCQPPSSQPHSQPALAALLQQHLRSISKQQSIAAPGA